jgi:hypothetical protein
MWASVSGCHCQGWQFKTMLSYTLYEVRKNMFIFAYLCVVNSYFSCVWKWFIYTTNTKCMFAVQHISRCNKFSLFKQFQENETKHFCKFLILLHIHSIWANKQRTFIQILYVQLHSAAVPTFILLNRDLDRSCFKFYRSVLFSASGGAAVLGAIFCVLLITWRWIRARGPQKQSPQGQQAV